MTHVDFGRSQSDVYAPTGAAPAKRGRQEGTTGMKVSELISLLEGCDPDAEVRIMMQESWPFECAIDGIAVREEFAPEDCECDRRIDEPHEEGCPADGWEDGCAGNDVFIVEGRQERYGSREAWSAARR